MIGGSDYDICHSIVVDSAGCAYVCGETISPDFPLKNSFQSGLRGFDGVFFKLGSNGDSLVFSSYMGGTDQDILEDVAIDPLGQVYLIGRTISTDIPLLNPYQSAISGVNNIEPFVMKLAATGNELIFGTYFGGSDDEWRGSIAVDAQGQAVVAGGTESADFPTKNPIQLYTRVVDSYVAKFGRNGDSLIFSTFIGGYRGDDMAYDLAVDSAGCSYIAGMTGSADFPQKNPFQQYYNGENAFISKISANGDSLVYSTFLGGTGSDEAFGIALVGDRAVVTGRTASANFPMKEPYQFNKPYQVFVTELSSAGNSLEFSTGIGGRFEEQGLGVAADHQGQIYITGHTSSTDFPAIGPIQEFAGEYDAFVTKLRAGFLCGDVDASQAIAISDIIYIIDYIFSGGRQPNPIVSSDVNCNGFINISDAVYLINYIFSGGAAPCASCP